MKLYYAPGACSMAPHIVLREAGFEFDLEKVDLGTKKTARGEDYTKVNPKGYVPTLQLDNGEFLTEAETVLQYLADQKPEAGLAPRMGTMARYRMMEWMNFLTSEIQKQFGPLFNPRVTPEWRENQLSVLERRLDYLNGRLADKPYLMDDNFTVADAYLFTLLNWSNFLSIDMRKWPTLRDYMARIAARPAVRGTMYAEGLSA